MTTQKIRPLTPEEASKKKQQHMISNIPDFVVEVVNDLIIKNYSKALGRSVVKQDDIVEQIVVRGYSSREELFNKKYLDIEPLFESYGWVVKYDKPAYNETYPATFEFRNK